MNLIIRIALIALFGLLAELLLPWWSIAIVAFLVEFFVGRPKGLSFLAGFLGIFLLWFVSAFIIDMKNDHILATKVANLMPLGGSGIALMLVTAFIGGLVGGLAAATGRAVKQATAKTNHINSIGYNYFIM